MLAEQHPARRRGRAQHPRSTGRTPPGRPGRWGPGGARHQPTASPGRGPGSAPNHSMAVSTTWPAVSAVSVHSICCRASRAPAAAAAGPTGRWSSSGRPGHQVGRRGAGRQRVRRASAAGTPRRARRAVPASSGPATRQRPATSTVTDSQPSASAWPAARSPERAPSESGVRATASRSQPIPVGSGEAPRPSRRAAPRRAVAPRRPRRPRPPGSSGRSPAPVDRDRLRRGAATTIRRRLAMAQRIPRSTQSSRCGARFGL